MTKAAEETPLLTPQGKTAEFPSAVKFIILTELCERFSFYGLRAILALYLTQHFRYSENQATSTIHIFTMCAYFSPLVGGYISDTQWGKYTTILLLSAVYIVGTTLLAFSAIGLAGRPPVEWPSMTALALIAVGTGGIKPCVSSFGGDQFSIEQEWQLPRFFSYFYLSINIGSIVSTILTPWLRWTFGFATAFAIPSLLLTIATLVFWSGRALYRHVSPSKENPLLNVTQVVWHCITNKSNSNSDWLSPAQGKFSAQLVEDTRQVLRVLSIFIPLPIFWALFDQQGSRWIFQAERMNRNVLGFEIQPDQMPVLNPILIVVLIPVFLNFVYPVLRQQGVALSAVDRMVYGMLVSCFSFVCSAAVEWVQNDGTQLWIAWQLPQYASLTVGEILVSVTGLEFAYSQAPSRMRSLLSACWLLTVSLGNMLVAVVAHFHLLSPTADALFYAFLILVASLLFTWICTKVGYMTFGEVKRLHVSV